MTDEIKPIISYGTKAKAKVEEERTKLMAFLTELREVISKHEIQIKVQRLNSYPVEEGFDDPVAYKTREEAEKEGYGIDFYVGQSLFVESGVMRIDVDSVDCMLTRAILKIEG
jgi:hypothetical protein